MRNKGQGKKKEGGNVSLRQLNIHIGLPSLQGEKEARHT
jgi:hypothetical protein